MSTTAQDLSTDLAKLIDAWPRLPDAVKAGILAMVRTMQADADD